MNRHVLTFVLLASFASQSQALVTFESAYSYRQVSDTVYSGGEDAIPLNLQRTETTPNSTYQFDIVSVPSSPVELRAQAGLSVDIDGRGTEIGWSSVEASATATTSLVDFAFVEGPQGASEGFIEFYWATSGISEISLAPKLNSDAYVIEELSTLGVLTSSVPGDVADILLNDQGNQPFGTKSVDSFVPDAVGVQQFFVPWSAGTEVPIVFDLMVTSQLKVLNRDAAGFVADVNADFTNTATLEAVNVFDADGNLLLDASVVGRDGFVYAAAAGGGGGGVGVTGVGTPVPNPNPDPNAVPEPSTIIVWTLLAGCAGLTQGRRRRRTA